MLSIEMLIQPNEKLQQWKVRQQKQSARGDEEGKEKKYIGGLNLENQSCLGGRLTVAPLVQ